MAKPPSQPHPSKEIDKFTDREDQQTRFRDLLNSPEGTTLPVLVFYGVGGVGKSWLGLRLREIVSDPEVKVPHFYLDFNPNSSVAGGTYHNDAALALAAIRRGFNIPCHRFDLAFVVLQHKNGVAAAPENRSAHAGKTLADGMMELGGVALESLPFGKLIAWTAKKGYEWGAPAARKTAAFQWLEKNFDREKAALLAMDPQTIRASLIERLGADLDANLPKRLGKQCRAVVFLDTYESLWRVGDSDARNRERDEWIRTLYESTEHVLYVILGRDRLDWEEINESWWGDASHLEQHHLGGLAISDARSFLHKCQIDTPDLMNRILSLCAHEQIGRTASGDAEIGYYPLKLGLCADTYHQLKIRGVVPDAADFDLQHSDLESIADRFLSALSDTEAHWLEKLSLPPRFDKIAAKAAYMEPPTPACDAIWALLTDLSFVTMSPDGIWWTLHGQMRDVLRKRSARNTDRERKNQEWWRKHWQSRSQDQTDEFAGLSWFHHYCLDPRQARTDWSKLAEAKRRALQMTSHLQTIGWWVLTEVERQSQPSEIEIDCLFAIAYEVQQASVGIRASNLRRAIACYQAALRVRTEEQFPMDWAMTQNNLGATYSDLPSGDRDANLRQAIACYQAALRVRTEEQFPQQWATTQNNLGNAYLQLPSGDRDANLRQAIACHQAALRVRTEEQFPMDWAMTQNNLGNAYSDLPSGDRDANLRQAIACHQAALRIYTEEQFPQQWAMTQINLGLTLLQQEQTVEALTFFSSAARGYRHVGMEDRAREIEAALEQIRRDSEAVDVADVDTQNG